MIPKALWGLPTEKEIRKERQREREKEAQRRRDEKFMENLREERASGVRIKVAQKIAI